MPSGVDALEWYDVLARLGAAALLGGLVGVEREIDGQDAGFRTHLLLALGAALFGVVSVGAFDAFVDQRADTNINIDVTRIASYVAAGVGFIGGGAILKSGGSVRGITTASSLWTVAAVGLAAGLGLWAAAVIASVIALVALALLRPVSNWLNRQIGRGQALVVSVDADRVVEIIDHVEQAVGATTKEITITRGEGNSMEVVVTFWSRLDAAAVGAVLDAIANRPGVRTLKLPS